MSQPDAYCLKLPDLISVCLSYSPFSANLHYIRASSESNAWITNIKHLGTKTDSTTVARWEKAVRNANGALLAAYAYPYAPYEKLRLCCDLTNMLYMMDEITDYQTEEDARKTMNLHVRVLSDGPSDESPVSYVSMSFRDNARALFRPHAFQRFLKVYGGYAHAVVVEAASRNKKQVLPVEEYRIFRRENGAVKPCFAIIEACFDLDLPDEVTTHPTFLRIYNAALDLVLWSNDLYSYKVERAKDGPTCSNVISSLMHHNNCTLQEAADYVGAEFERLLAQISIDKKRLPSFGSPEIDRQVKAFVYGLETWVIGNVRFSFDTQRYLGRDREEIERSLIVKLLPDPTSDIEEYD